MKHLEKRANLYYAVLTVPADVRHIIGKLRFVQSTQTDNLSEAIGRVAALVHRWKAEIAKARGRLPDAKASFWESLRSDYINAQSDGDEGVMGVIEDLAEIASLKVKDVEEGSNLYKFATNQAGTLLAPLVEDWKSSLRLAPKTIDQQYRDVKRMAVHFVSVQALQPQKVKAWTDKLIIEGTTSSSLDRIVNGCRSLWKYLQDSGSIPMDAPDPYVGSFRLAKKTAKRNTVERQAFTAKDLAKVYQKAVANGDTTLSHLIALGAFTGARIEELCSLKVEDSTGGKFHITDAKTVAGIREVPIHPAIAPLVGALRKESKDGYLIPSTAAGKYGVRSDPLSKRFGRLKESMGFGPGHVFHSIRKTVATLLEQADVMEGIAADILGHEKKTLSYGLYSGGSSMEQKKKALAKVTYPEPLGKPKAQ